MEKEKLNRRDAFTIKYSHQIMFERQKISGIPNKGNTCYINSTLQILKFTPNFLNVLTNLRGENKTLSGLLLEFFRDFDETNNNSLNGLLSFIYQKLKFRKDCQEDSEKLMSVMISTLEKEELAIKKGKLQNQEIRKLFFGSAKYKTTCKKNKSHPLDTATLDFTVLNLPLAEFENKISDFFIPRLVNGLECEECGFQCEEKIEFDKVPSTLILAFEQGGHEIDLEETIVLKEKDQEKKFHLYGKIIYIGNSYNGHYYAHARVERTNTEKDMFYSFNDNFPPFEITKEKFLSGKNVRMAFYSLAEKITDTNFSDINEYEEEFKINIPQKSQEIKFIVKSSNEKKHLMKEEEQIPQKNIIVLFFVLVASKFDIFIIYSANFIQKESIKNELYSKMGKNAFGLINITPKNNLIKENKLFNQFEKVERGKLPKIKNQPEKATKKMFETQNNKNLIKAKVSLQTKNVNKQIDKARTEKAKQIVTSLKGKN